MDHQFVSTQMQGRHEEAIQQEKREDDLKYKIPTLSRFKSLETFDSPPSSATPATILSRAKSAKPARKPTKKRKDPSTLQDLARNKFKSNQLAYLSGKGKIDQFMKKIVSANDINSLKTPEISNLYTREEWMLVLHHIRQKFPDLGTKGKRNLRWIIKEAQREEEPDLQTLWSQASLKPDASLGEEDYIWLYDYNGEVRDVDPTEVSFDELSIFVNTLSQNVFDDENAVEVSAENSIIDNNDTGKKNDDESMQEDSQLSPQEVVSDSESEIEELRCRTPVSSHQPVVESTAYCSFTFPDHVVEIDDSLDMQTNIEQVIGKPTPMSSPFILDRDKIPRLSDKDMDLPGFLILPLVRRKNKKLPLQDIIAVGGEDSILPESANVSIPIEGKNVLPVDERTANLPNGESIVIDLPLKESNVSRGEGIQQVSGSLSIRLPESIAIKLPLQQNVSTPLVSKEKRQVTALPANLKKDELSATKSPAHGQNSLLPAKLLTPITTTVKRPELSVRSEVVFSEEEYSTAKSRLDSLQIQSSLPVHRKKKRKTLRTTRYEVVSAMHFTEYNDEHNGVRMRPILSEPVVIDSDNEVPDLQDEDGCISVLEITREIAESTENEDPHNTSVVQVPSSPQGILGYLLDGSDESINEVVESPIKWREGVHNE